MPQTDDNLTYSGYEKIAPILCNIGLDKSQITAYSMLHYQNPYLITTGDLKTMRQNTPDNGLVIDRIEDAFPHMQGVVNPARPAPRLRRRVAAAYHPAFTGGIFASLSNAVDVLPIVEWANIAVPRTLRTLAGYIEPAINETLAPAWMDLPGNLVDMPIDGATVPLNSPVYISNTGGPTLVPPTGLNRRVGWTQSAKAPCTVRMDFAPNMVAPSMPLSGEFAVGDVVDILTPVVKGNAGSRYTLLGWRRLTTGSGHVLGTDWVERREPTGT